MAALRRHGPSTLLWVTTAQSDRPSGMVERVADGLLRGYVDRFAYQDPDTLDFDISLAAWAEVCRNAWHLWRNPAQWRLHPAPRLPPVNLLPPPGKLPDPETWAPRVRDGLEVWRHGVTPGQGVARFQVPGAIAPALGTVHVVSAWFWIPADFRGSELGVFLDGRPSLRLCNARVDLRETWQRAWATAIPEPSGATAALHLLAPEGDCVFSTGWTVEEGFSPGDDTCPDRPLA